MADDFTTHLVIAQQKHIFAEIIHNINMPVPEQNKVLTCMQSQIKFNCQNTIHQLETIQKIKSSSFKVSNFVPKASWLQIPQFNESYIKLLPQNLENQFHFRFHDEQNDFMYKFDWDTSDLFISILNFASQDEPIYFAMNSENFMQKQVLNKCRIIVNHKIEKFEKVQLKAFNPETDDIKPLFKGKQNSDENEKWVLVLHDFYQHPITIVHFLNHIRKKGYQILCPYLNDIIQTCEQEQFSLHEPLQNNIVQHVQNIIEYYISGTFQIIACGTSSSIAMTLQKQYGMQCEKVVLCSPIIHFGFKEKKKDEQSSEQSALDISLQELPLQEPEHVSDMSLMLSAITNQPDEPIQIRNRKLSIRKQNMSNEKSSEIECVHGGYNIRIPIAQNRMIERQQKQMKKVIIKENKEEEKRSVSVLKQLAKSQRLDDVAKKDAEHLNDIIFLMNEKLNVIYDDPQLIYCHLLAYKADSVKDLQISDDKLKFADLYSVISPMRRMQQKLYTLLYSPLLLSPFDAILSYHQNSSYLDKDYFKGLQELPHWNTEPVEVFPDQQVYVLIGTHDCYIGIELLQSVLNINKKFQKFHCRTVCGAGHDLFSVVPEIITKLLK